MSIRVIAKDLYGLQQEVERLEKELKAAPSGKRADLEDQLCKIRAECNHLKGILEDSKEPPPYRLPR